jgi:hypothetical protein
MSTATALAITALIVINRCSRAHLISTAVPNQIPDYETFRRAQIARGPWRHRSLGGYEDTFEKSANGWRFKSRVHVWPEIQWTDDPADMRHGDLKKE